MESDPNNIYHKKGTKCKKKYPVKKGYTNPEKIMSESECTLFLRTIRNGTEPFRDIYYLSAWQQINLGIRIGEIPLLQGRCYEMIKTHQCMLVPTLKQKQEDGSVPDVPIYLNQIESKFLMSHPLLLNKGTMEYIIPLSVRKLDYLFNYYREKAGLRSTLVPHSMRHACSASMLSDMGLGDGLVMSTLRLRHSFPSSANAEYTIKTLPPQMQLKLLERRRVFF